MPTPASARPNEPTTAELLAAAAIRTPHDSDEGVRRPITASGALIGTADYMAPELARRGVAPTSAVDIFAFGLMAWELLSGERPFSAPPLFFAFAGTPLPAPPPLGSGITGELAEGLRRALSEVPAERPTARELVKMLDAWNAG